ncbi:hypothetical protein FRC09_011284 [Ceratobasidium sp. 395]|nr:hypothetical protein FRC09_011284 [Ceratobasidium sp. 395]
MEADLIPVVAIQQDTERPGLGSLTSQELWLIDHKSQQRSGLPVLGKPFSLGDIIEICERIIREYAALTINAPVPVCGSIWFESTLSDYLRGRRYTMQTAQGPIDDSNNNALEEHAVLVAAPVSLSGYMPVDTKTNGQLKGGHGVGAYLSYVDRWPGMILSFSIDYGIPSSVSSISEPQSRAFASASVSQRDRSASAAMVPVHIPSVPTYELTPVEEPPLQMEFRGSRSKEAVDYGVTAKRKMDTLEEEKSKIKPNMKRAKTTDAGTEGAADVGTEPLISLAISKTMPLPDVVALLLQHGCQDITKMINLPACSEYPLSSGGFGDIFQGKLNDSTSVAIKCVRMVIDPYSSEHKKYLKCAAREIHTWSKLNHRYVSKLLGLAQFRGQIAMISPWAEHGALPGFLTRRPQHNRPRLCAQIAEGLAFLHKQKIVHGDLKGANILISENYEPLLTDFGNATLHDRSLQFTCTTAKSNFSLRWTAPELLDEAPSSFEADVYALGMYVYG